ncbi:hypothetical protein HU200_007097 [Digitaria exilis]|uniref:non-specific serine/threonine protein kinase n=1 Tax=Digitaria exilis TaxID=1010633 RepID=A0A835FPY8_9POAL|nr:hypothetical protein HU200_007097 [Digitaria exilis]
MAVLALALLLLTSLQLAVADQFTYDGFAGASLALDGAARVAPNGLLVMTNDTAAMTGHALHPSPLRFRDEAAPNGSVRSFSASFVFAIVSPHLQRSHGLAFFVSRTRNLSTTTMPYQYLGLLNTTDGDDGAVTNHILAVELDTVLNYEFADIDNNHVGIDVDSLRSVAAASAGYYDADDNGGEAMQVWVDYDGNSTVLDVTLAPAGEPKPNKPLVSISVDLAAVVPAGAYVGFSSSTGAMACSHYVLGWSFALDTAAPPLDTSRLPEYPKPTRRRKKKVMAIVLPVVAIAIVVVVVSVAGVVVYVRRRMEEYVELREDWEAEFGAHRFPYKDLYRATNGFTKKRLVGKGGSGEVYRGVLRTRCGSVVAVKRVSDESRQRTTEFVAEVASMGRLRHRNLVPLLGYCRRKGELLLVYSYMPNGSLDKFLYDQDSKITLSWDQRFQIIKDVAAGLLYLHEEWEQVIVHRDIKPSNVLLDDEMKGRLGDFGLARVYDHGATNSSYTTSVVGTMGYLAPELMRTGKTSPATDVYAFGAFLLEVACGKRPIDEEGLEGEESLTLVEYVLGHWHKSTFLDIDSKVRSWTLTAASIYRQLDRLSAELQKGRSI